MQGGLGAGELGVVVAPAGIGKSWVLSAMGAYAISQGLNVVHYTLELNEAYVGLRYDSIFTGVESQNLKYHKEEVMEKLFDLKGNLIGINTFKTTGYGNYYSLPAAWIKPLMNKEIETVFPINGKALWEEDEDKKPYFLKIAIPKTKKNWAELKIVTEKWVRDEPRNTEAWYELGYANEKLGKVADALVAYDKALEIDQNNSDALLREAVIYKKKGDANEVAKIQSTLDDVDPNKAWILKNNKY